MGKFIGHDLFTVLSGLAGSGLSLLQDKALLQALPEHVERAAHIAAPGSSLVVECENALKCIDMS